MAPRVFYSSLFFVLVITLVIFLRPSIVFDPDGSIRPFGFGDRDTILPFGVVIVIAAVISMFLFAWVDLITAS
jgi:hypothetical protein